MEIEFFLFLSNVNHVSFVRNQKKYVEMERENKNLNADNHASIKDSFFLFSVRQKQP